MKFICLFFPGLLALKYSIEENDKPQTIIGKYAGYTLLIQMCIMVALMILFDPHRLFADDLFTFRFTLLYLLVGSILGIIIPKITFYFKKNIKISLKRNKK